MNIAPGDRIYWFKTNGNCNWSKIAAVYVGLSNNKAKYKIKFIDERTGEVVTRYVPPDMIERIKE